jgi:DNA-binding LytR/AlgR family response regulator
MKIAIFENEFESVKGAFDTANLLYFNEGLVITYFPSSQSASNVEMKEFDVIFIDIDLSSKSELDGFSLINKFIETNKALIGRIVILTGNNKIQEALKARSIDYKLIQIIIKPTNYEEINDSIKRITASA